MKDLQFLIEFSSDVSPYFMMQNSPYVNGVVINWLPYDNFALFGFVVVDDTCPN